jgi:hypothetical protein
MEISKFANGNLEILKRYISIQYMPLLYINTEYSNFEIFSQQFSAKYFYRVHAGTNLTLITSITVITTSITTSVVSTIPRRVGRIRRTS